jgi:CheY-like chemotaxis protein
VHETLEEVPFVGPCCAPRLLERFVGLEVAACAAEREPSLECALDCHVGQCYAHWTVATILLCGVDLYFRGKLDALLPDHHLITTENVDPPDLVIADIARIDADEVADAYPDVPIIGFTNHTDTAGLRAAQAAGFDQVLAKSALVERVGAIVDELLGEPADPS